MYSPTRSANNPASFAAGVGLANGGGASFSAVGAQPYVDVLRAFSPIQLESGNFFENDFGFSLVDINADGLADLVRNHEKRQGDILDGPGGGQVLINTGMTWETLDGVTGWQIRPGRGAVPIVPDFADWNQTPKNPPVFIDLNGDGVTDVINVHSAWLNSFRPPTINSFPNGLDSGPSGTIVEYDVITTGAARAGSSPTYTDSGTLDPGTAYATLPIPVVKAMHVPNGSGGIATTSYQYSDLRLSAFHYGSQGFKTVTVTEPTDATTGAAGLITETTYAQIYPFTGVPLSVSRYSQDPVTKARTGLVTSTVTTYCERNLPDLPGVTCGDMTPKLYPPRSTFFVHPTLVQETSILRTSSFPPTETFRRVHTNTEFHFDDLGNSTRTTVTIQGLGETHMTETHNDYSDPDPLVQQQGKVTRTVVTTTGADGSTRSHANAFEYRRFSGVLALAKKKVNADAPDDDHARLDTAYDYDPFGNIKTITSCESNFDACETNASSTLPFRTTRITYDPVEAGLTVDYGPGRFPAMVTNAVGHQELTVYDPMFGGILNTRDPNGIQTCTGYDAFGQVASKTVRCNSTDPANPPLTTTTTRRLAVDTFGTNARVVTITTPPSGTPTWTFTDVLGRPVALVTRSFGGGFAETLTEYDFLGRVRRTSKPFLAGGEPAWTETKYDPLGRPTTVTQDLGPLGDVSTGAGTATSVLTMTYGVNNSAAPSGVSVQSTRVVAGRTRSKLETKNAIGKVIAVSEVQPSSGVNQTMKYEYDADGNLTKTTDPADNAIVIGYDVYGRKTSIQDPDLGTWSYTYNGFGELVSQKDAKNQTTTSMYDLLGRLTSRTDPSGVSQWVYDVAPGAGKGRLAATAGVPDPGLRGTCTIPFIAGPGNRPGRSLTYTAFGDVAETEECVDGDAFRTTYQYDGSGRPEVLTYPDVNGTRFAVRNHYTSAGYLHFVSDPTNDNTIYWAASEMNAAGQVTGEFTGNGVDTVSAISPATGWLLSRASTANLDGGKLIQSRAFAFDEAGNLRRRVRTDQVAPTHSDEVFDYDDFDRSLGYNEASTAYHEGYGYDALGNISTKVTQTANTYHYNTGCKAGTQRDAGPHAVCSITGGLTASFSYDDNGNTVSGGGREITYNPSNKVTQIDYQSPGGTATSVAFSYGGDGNRVLQEVTASGSTARTIYVGLGGTGKSLYERTTRTTSGATTTEHTHFIYAGGAHNGNAFAVRVVSGGGSPTPAMKYQHFDHLGSVTAVSDEQGHVVDLDSSGRNPGVLSYDPWGARRASETAGADPSAYDSPPGHREFTGHETIPGVALVNMNGRIYDPILGRFLSPDPNIQSVTSSQSYNRYSYVLNNPLKYTDPTGYWYHELMSGLMSGITSALQKYNPTTMEGFKNLFELGLGAFVCAASEGIGCALWSTGMAIFDTAVAISNGAPVVQSLEQLGIGLAVGYLAGKTGATGPITSMLNGAASAAVTTGLTNVVKGRPLGENVLGAAGAAAAMAGIKYVIKYEVALSQAASERQARDEAMERLNSVAAGIAAERAQTWVGPVPPLITEGALAEEGHDQLSESLLKSMEAIPHLMEIITGLGRHYADPSIPELKGLTWAVRLGALTSIAHSLSEGRIPITGTLTLAVSLLEIPPPFGEIAAGGILVGGLIFGDPKMPDLHLDVQLQLHLESMGSSFCNTLPICGGSPAGMAGY
jgi:RHS repeat-associated protein